jgi:predicted RNase H-like nuclease (RuvC/YqgF family)
MKRIHGAMEDASKDIFQRYEEKHVDFYERIEKELKEVQQAVHLVCAVPTTSSTPSSS